ncbi:MAG: preprotein translocase subunit YajC [Candidatus Marinimicrobia bacterium]|nr:preprotein translocase subunit YajC [Candidatus Neomarinimicrobiota bacterium]
MLSIMLQVANGAADGAVGGRGIMSFLPFILIIVVLWFLMIMPQRKRQKETKKMLEALQPKDKVVTIGGVIAEIVKVKKDSIVLKIGKDTQMEVRRSAIASKLVDEKKDDSETK